MFKILLKRGEKMFFRRRIKPYTKKRFHKFKFFIFIFLFIFILCCFLILMQFENNVLPSALVISEKYTTTAVNNIINKSVEEVINEKDIVSSDFFKSNLNSAEQMNYLSVNTMLINEVCSNIAVNISKNLNLIENKKIELPIGILSGIKILSNTGPKCKILLDSMGDAVVDYETSFSAVGINQVNFQVWLNIETNISVVNPFYTKDMIIKRKLMLVNTVFSGDVPSAYLDLNK